MTSGSHRTTKPRNGHIGERPQPRLAQRPRSWEASRHFWMRGKASEMLRELPGLSPGVVLCGAVWLGSWDRESRASIQTPKRRHSSRAHTRRQWATNRSSSRTWAGLSRGECESQFKICQKEAALVSRVRLCLCFAPDSVQVRGCGYLG